MAETKAANLRLEIDAYSQLHYLSAVEGRSKAEIVAEALRDYAEAHRDRLESYVREVASVAGLKLAPGSLRPSRPRSEILARARDRRRLAKV
jgi:predicted DNA-binding protein